MPRPSLLNQIESNQRNSQTQRITVNLACVLQSVGASPSQRPNKVQSGFGNGGEFSHCMFYLFIIILIVNDRRRRTARSSIGSTANHMINRWMLLTTRQAQCSIVLTHGLHLITTNKTQGLIIDLSINVIQIKHTTVKIQS